MITKTEKSQVTLFNVTDQREFVLLSASRQDYQQDIGAQFSMHFLITVSTEMMTL